MCDDERTPYGARAVGALASAQPTVRLYVWMLRRWLDGVCGQQAMWNHFAAASDPRSGHIAMGLFEAHMSALAKHARRKLYRHGSECSCLGADEAALAAVIDRAQAGASTEAYQAAALVAHGAGLFETVETATHLARTLAPIAESVLAAIDADAEAVRFGGTSLDLSITSHKPH